MAGRVQKLTGRQLIFCREYLIDGCAKRAAEVAGYSHPAETSVKLLDPERYPLVVAYIRKEQQAIAERSRIKGDRVLEELAHVALFNPQDLLGPDGSVMKLKEMPANVARAIASMKVTYGEEPDGEGGYTQVKHVDLKFWSKLGALQQIADILGLSSSNTTVNFMTLDWKALFTPRNIEDALRGDPIREEIASVRALPRPVIECRAELTDLQNGHNGNGHSNGSNGNGH
jgi:hypothetical protein